MSYSHEPLNPNAKHPKYVGRYIVHDMQACLIFVHSSHEALVCVNGIFKSAPIHPWNLLKERCASAAVMYQGDVPYIIEADGTVWDIDNLVKLDSELTTPIHEACNQAIKDGHVLVRNT